MSRSLAAGDLRHPLILEGPVYTPDGAGGMTETWVERGQLWAAIDPSGGAERASGEVTVSASRYRVFVRAAPDGAPGRPKPRQRFRSGDRILRITSVQEHDQYGRFLRCHAIEETTA